MSKPRTTVARKNSLADNRKKPWAEPDSEGNHLPLVGTGFNQIYWVHLESSHVGMRWQVTVAGRGCPAGLGWISGPGGGGLGTWARAPGRCPEQGEKKENMFRGFRCSLIKQSRKDRGVMVLVGVELCALLHATLAFLRDGRGHVFTLRHTDSSWWIPSLLIGAGLCRLAD